MTAQLLDCLTLDVSDGSLRDAQERRHFSLGEEPFVAHSAACRYPNQRLLRLLGTKAVLSSSCGFPFLRQDESRFPVGQTRSLPALTPGLVAEARDIEFAPAGPVNRSFDDFPCTRTSTLYAQG